MIIGAGKELMFTKWAIVLILSSFLAACSTNQDEPETVLIAHSFAWCVGPNYENILRGTGICLPGEQEGYACQLPDMTMHVFRSTAECLENGGTDDFRIR